VTAWRPDGTLAWRFRSQQFCVGARYTFTFAAFLIIGHDPGGGGVSNARTTMMSWLTAAITGQRRRGGGATPADCSCFAIAKSNVAGFEYQYGGG